MKKTLALVLALAMVLSLASFAMAAEPKKDKWDSDVHDSEDYFKYDGYAYEYRDFFDIKSGEDTLIPGNEYYYEVTINGKPVTDAFFNDYNVEVRVGTAYPKATSEERKEDNYLSSTSAEKLVKKADLVKMNGKYYLHLDISSSFPYTNEKDFKATVIAKDKQNDTYRSRADIELTIGYSKNSKDVVYVDSPEAEVDNDRPIMEFAEDIGDFTIEMEDGSLFEVELSRKKETKVNFHHSLQENQAVRLANPSAKMNFIDFTAHPGFMKNGRLLLKAPSGMNYAYEILSNGTLQQVGAKPMNGYIAVVTSKLGSYVVSDRALKNAVASIAPSTPSVPSQGGNVPFNPGTGAAI